MLGILLASLLLQSAWLSSESFHLPRLQTRLAQPRTILRQQVEWHDRGEWAGGDLGGSFRDDDADVEGEYGTFSPGMQWSEEPPYFDEDDGASDEAFPTSAVFQGQINALERRVTVLEKDTRSASKAIAAISMLAVPVMLLSSYLGSMSWRSLS